MKNLLITLVLMAVFLPFPSVANACGPDTDCMVQGDRHYRIRMPEGHDGVSKVGAIVYAHGYRGSANAMMRNKSMAKMVSDMGLALIATKSYADDWRIPGVPRNGDNDGSLELTYYDAVIEDVTNRFPVDPDRIMATGFSAGGMMVWNLICYRSGLFAGFVPISGTFWEPEPETCTTSPANVIHIHGDADPVVPLMGRPIADTHQGQVPEVLSMYRQYGKYKPSGSSEKGLLRCEESRNSDGKVLHYCLFAGGHSFRSEFIRQAWETLKEAGKL